MGITSDIHAFACTRYDAEAERDPAEVLEELRRDFDQYVDEMHAMWETEARTAEASEQSRRNGRDISASEFVAQLRARNAERSA